MKVFLTGATGFVGRHVLAELLHRGHLVHALARTRPTPPPRPDATPNPAPRWFQGHLADPDSLAAAADGCDAAVHLVGIIRETQSQSFAFVHIDGTRNVLTACQSVGIRRYLHMSALGTRPPPPDGDAVSAYHRTKFAAEQLVRGGPLAWTIFRPSMITGHDGEFTRMVRAWSEGRAAPWLFFPYFRAGLLGLGPHTRIQPVAVHDVARAFVDALSLPETAGHTFDLVGPDRLTWPEFYRRLADHERLKPKPALPIPLWYAKLLTALVPARLLPFNRDQVQMAAEDNTGNPAPFTQAFGWAPRAFSEQGVQAPR